MDSWPLKRLKVDLIVT